MENGIYSMENLRMVSGICDLLSTLALPKSVDKKLNELFWECGKHLNCENLTGKDTNADD